MTTWLIVGAGFTGSVLARQIATELNQKVVVIDQRDHIAGNAYDYLDDDGVLVHKYGPHIFHTNSEKVWKYLSQFTEWRPYFHRVVGMVEGNEVPVPFNLNSIEACFPPYLADRLTRQLVETFGFGKKVPILKLREAGGEDLQFLADYVYEHVFKHYTMKQWGLTPEQLDPGVTARVPVFVSRDNRYFQDHYQAMPTQGYTAMFQNILDHELIDVRLSTGLRDVKDQFADARIIFTGPIDEFFDYEYGALPYRSLRFRQVKVPTSDLVQPAGTVNYPNEFDFTRITELKHLTGQHTPTGLLLEEYPQAYEVGKNDPYYPIPNDDTAELLKPYQERARALAGKVWFAGRLGDYAYYNMDQACARALALFEKQIAPLVRSESE